VGIFTECTLVEFVVVVDGGESDESIRFRLRFDDDGSLLLFVLFVARNLISPDGCTNDRPFDAKKQKVI
jgi:hypothetical protein